MTAVLVWWLRRSSNWLLALVSAARLQMAQPMSIRRLLRWQMAILLVPLLAFGLYLALRVASAERGVLEAKRADVTNNMSFLVDQKLERLISTLRTLSVSPDLVRGDFAAFRAPAMAAATFAQFEPIAVHDRTGRELFSSGHATGGASQSGAGQIELAAAFEGKVSVSSVLRAAGDNHPMIRMAVPVWRDGKVVQALSGTVHADMFRDTFADAGLDPAWTAAVVDRVGNFVTRWPDHDRFVGRLAKPALVEAVQTGETAGQFSNITHEDVATASNFRRLRLADWIAVVAVPTVTLETPLWRSFQLLLLFGALVTAATLGLAALLVRRVSEPLKIMGQSATALATGRPLPLLQPKLTELADVTSAFKKAETILMERTRFEQRLAAAEERQRLAIKAGDFGTWDADLQSDRTQWSERYYTLLGYPAPASDAPPLSIDLWRARLHPEDRAHALAALERARIKGDRYQSEYRIIRADTGAIAWLRSDGEFLRDAVSGGVRFIGVTRDITKRKLTALALAESKERLAVALVAGKLGVSDYDLATGIIQCDATVREIWGISASEIFTFNRSMAGVVAEDRGNVTAALKVAMDPTGTGAFSDQFRVRNRRDSTVRWVSATGSIKFVDGVAARWIGTIQDISDRKRAELALAASELRFRLAAEAVDGIIYDNDAVTGHVDRSMRLESLLGWKPDDVPATIKWWRDQIHPEDLPRVMAKFEAAVANQERTDRQIYRVRHRDGGWLHLQDHALLIYDDTGQLLRTVGATADVTDEIKSAEILRQRSVHLSQAAVAAKLTHLAWEPEVGRVWVATNFTEVLGVAIPAPDDAGQYDWRYLRSLLLKHVPADDFAQLAVAQGHVLAGREQIGRMQSRVTSDDGKLRWIETIWIMERASDGSPERLIATLLDITDKKQTEERIRQLMGEINHRSRNLMGVVQSVARQTAQYGDPATFLQRFTMRLQALAASQDLLLTGVRGGVPLDELIRSQLGHVSELIGGRIILAGPSMRIGAAATQCLGMAIHELSTNASKYGALSNDQGNVGIEWAMYGLPGTGDFMMRWSERGGPSVKPPEHHGFGHRVIVGMVEATVQGKVTVDHAPAGVAWELRCPVAAVIDASMGSSLDHERIRA